jgi:hypothetical protein
MNDSMEVFYNLKTAKKRIMKGYHLGVWTKLMIEEFVQREGK